MDNKREAYLDRIISNANDGHVKVIARIKRFGKSYLLFHLYRNYLLNNGVKECRTYI